MLVLKPYPVFLMSAENTQCTISEYWMINYLASVADKRSDAYKLKNAKNNNQDAGKHPHIQHRDIGNPRRHKVN